VSFQKVLVAYDFSEPSRRALEFACKVVRASGGHLDVVHIHPELYVGEGPGLEFPWPKPEQVEHYVRFLKQELHDATPRDLDGQAASHVFVGDPKLSLLGRAQELGSDVIVVGATGKGLVDRALLGSVSRSLVHHSQVPVVTVP
jgi:nucleotide-binding universal stress UspA family protein